MKTIINRAVDTLGTVNSVKLQGGVNMLILVTTVFVIDYTLRKAWEYNEARKSKGVEG